MLSKRRNETMLSTALPAAGTPESTNGPACSPAPPRQPRVSRFSVSLPSNLLEKLDGMVTHRRLPNRSHAIAEMARRQLTEHARELGTTSMAGTISLVYDYRKRNLQRKLADIQHQNFLMVVTSMHVHLENYHYLEVLLVQGQPRALRVLADTLAACKGVEQANLQLTATAMPPLL
jgi:CopG family nickel-responsive transcriptional regulator